MIFFKINIFLNILKIFLVSIFCISISLAQEENLGENNNDLSISQTFPIAVVDMQRIVGQSSAAVKVREYIENKYLD